MKLRHYIREMVESELAEMARISTNIKIGDAEKVEAARELYDGTWIADMIDYVKETGETGIPQPDLARKLGKSGQQAINPKVRDFLEANIFTKGELSVPKKEKPELSGVKGRPTSEKTLVAKALNSKLEADSDYEPNEDELATLGDEFIEKLRMRVKGVLKRGRPLMPSKAKDGMMAAMKNIGDEDVDMDGDIDDEDLDQVNENEINEAAGDLNISDAAWKKWLEMSEELEYEDYDLTTHNYLQINNLFKELKWVEKNVNKYDGEELLSAFDKFIDTHIFNSPNEPMNENVNKSLNESFTRMQKIAGLIK